MRVDACIWNFGVDYPGAEGDDSKLPIASVSLKAWDAIYWMSTFDKHPSAISGPASIAKAVKVFGDQGIDLYLWCVPKGRNVNRMVELSLQCLDVPGVKGLIFDLEPFAGFCAADCPYLAQTLGRTVRQLRPNAWLGAHYDPRPWHHAATGLDQWLKTPLDAALPMTYWTSYAGQGEWASPVTAVQIAAGQLRNAYGFTGEYFPILQGAAPADEMRRAVNAAAAVGAKRVSLWRRGVVQAETWAMLRGLVTPAPPPEPPAPEPQPAPIEGELTMSQYEELKALITSWEQNLHAQINDMRSWVQVSVHDAIVGRLAALERKVEALSLAPPSAPPPNVAYHTVRDREVASGIAVKYGLSWNAFVALNPQGPRSGDWNAIYPGEEFRVR